MRDADHALSGPTRTSCLPKLAPFKRPMKAPGALSNPSVMYSLYFTLPAPTHGAHRGLTRAKSSSNEFFRDVKAGAHHEWWSSSRTRDPRVVENVTVP